MSTIEIKYFMKSCLLTCLFFSYSLTYWENCNKLSNGSYRVHFSNPIFKDFQLNISDSTFVAYTESKDSSLGKIRWIYDCIFSMDYLYPKMQDSITGPLKLMYDSWGKPCIELNKVSGDTIYFRTTFPKNLHITYNEGCFMKLRK